MISVRGPKRRPNPPARITPFNGSRFDLLTQHLEWKIKRDRQLSRGAQIRTKIVNYSVPEAYETLRLSPWWAPITEHKRHMNGLEGV